MLINFLEGGYQMSKTRKKRQKPKIDVGGEGLAPMQRKSADGRERSQNIICDRIDMRSQHFLEGLYKIEVRTATN